MIRASVGFFNRLIPGVGYFASRRWFEHISTYDSGRHLLFMNYGYAAEPPITLQTDDEEHRYFIQLYHHTASAIDLQGLDVLEVGCGRGGGSSYMARYLKPKSLVAVDLAANAIDFCQKQYTNIPNVRFERADAQDLPYEDNSFDALVNVESSICYPDVNKFLAEVVRVLRPGGYFLYADIRNQDELADWNTQLANLPLEKVTEETITPNVLRALDLDNARKERLIGQYAPRILHPIFKEFAGMKGSKFFYGAFASGEKVYKRFVFRKPNKLVS